MRGLFLEFGRSGLKNRLLQLFQMNDFGGFQLSSSLTGGITAGLALRRYQLADDNILLEAGQFILLAVNSGVSEDTGRLLE